MRQLRLWSDSYRSRVFPFFGIALLATALFLPRMLTWPLRHWDEAWYAQTSHEILESGDWLTLQWNNAPWFHKPPLTFWATAAAFTAFGESEFTARLFSSLCGLSTIVLVAWFVGRVLGAGAGFLAGAILLAIPEFSRFATRGQTDSPVALCIALQLTLFWIGLDRPQIHLLGGLAFGFALMTKGAAAGLAGVVELAYVLSARDGRPLRQWQWWIAPILGVLIAAPWHLHQMATHGEAFTNVYFSRHFNQFFNDIYPEVDHAAAPPTYYLDFLLRKQPEWGWLAVATMMIGFAAALRRPSDRFLMFALCWTVSIPLVLSFAWAKWYWYLVPAYPGLAILAATLVHRVSAGSFYSRIATGFAVMAAVVGTSEVSWTKDRELEHELRGIGRRMQIHLPAGSQFIALQIDSDRETSVYPVTPRYYAKRSVLTMHNVEELIHAGRRTGNVVFALVHEDLVDEITCGGNSRDVDIPSTSPGKVGPNRIDRDFEVEIVDREEPIMLIRITPAWLAEQVRQAARNNAESR